MEIVIIKGNLTKKGVRPGVMPSGTEVSNFTVVTNRNWTDAHGNPQTRKTFWQVSVTNGQAPACNQYLYPRREVVLQGYLLTSPDDEGNPKVWHDADGNPHASFELRANNVEFCGPTTSPYDDEGNEIAAGAGTSAKDVDNIPF